MTQKRKPPTPFTPSPNNIRVNNVKEIGDKFDYESLSPMDKLAVNLAARDLLLYLFTKIRLKDKLEGMTGDLNNTGGDDLPGE